MVNGDESEVGEVTREAVIAAPPDEVWQALVDADRRKRWWSYLQLDPVIGGGFIERWTGPAGESMVTMGSVLEVTANRLLRLTWSDDNWPVETQVEISLSPTPGGTLVRVRHSGFERLTDGRRLATEHGAGWQLHLSNLRSLAEHGGSGERGVG